MGTVNKLDEKLEKKIIEDIATIKEQNKTLFHRVNNLEEDKEILHKMETLMEVSTNIQKELVISVKEMSTKQTRFEETFNKINDNLSSINNDHKDMQVKLTTIQTNVTDNEEKLKKVEELANKNKDKGKFDVVEFISKDMMKYIGLAIVGAILYYIGLSK